MVVGSGMIAQAFHKYIDNAGVVIFASGVSNSKENNPIAYSREENLLNRTIDENKDKTIVYFSTCSIYDNSVNSSKYVKHKVYMEKIVERRCDKFHIFRLPQVVGVTNSPTLVNYLFMSIKNHIPLTINKNSTRNLIHVDDVVKIISYLIDNKIYCNEITNIATPHNTMVLDIVVKIEKIMQMKANYQLIEFGAKQNIDISKMQELNIESDIFDINYTDEILSKYYAQMGAFYETEKMTK